MNVSNPSRSQLSNVPGLNKAIDFMCARINDVFSAQHNPEDGTHTTITATGSITERARSVALGEWTDFTPTQTAAVGTWTGSTITTAHYMLVGKTMFISVAIDAGNNSNATPAVFVDIPGGFTASKDDYAWAEILDSGVLIANSLVKTSAGATRISFTSLVGNIAVNAANGLYVRGQIAFEVQ